jgi:hypothetical protein
MAACATTRSSAMTNALDYVAWWRRGCNKVIIAATCGSSSSLLGYLHSRPDKGAAGAEDAAASPTATAKFIFGKHINQNNSIKCIIISFYN